MDKMDIENFYWVTSAGVERIRQFFGPTVKIPDKLIIKLNGSGAIIYPSSLLRVKARVMKHWREEYLVPIGEMYFIFKNIKFNPREVIYEMGFRGFNGNLYLGAERSKYSYHYQTIIDFALGYYWRGKKYLI